MTTNPWVGGVLPRRFIELVGVALNAACTNFTPNGTRRHIRAALRAGATRGEILLVIKCAALMSIHSCSIEAPLLLEEAKAAGAAPVPLWVALTRWSGGIRMAGIGALPSVAPVPARVSSTKPLRSLSLTA